MENSSLPCLIQVLILFRAKLGIG